MLAYVNNVYRHSLSDTFVHIHGIQVACQVGGSPTLSVSLYCPHATEFHEALPAVARDNINESL